MTEWYRTFPYFRDYSPPLVKDQYIIPLLILFITDVLVLVGSCLTAYAIRFYSPLFLYYPPPDPPYIPSLFNYLFLSFMIAGMGTFVFERFGLYQRRIGLDRNVQSITMVIAILVTYIFVMALLFNYRQFSYSRLTVAMAIPISCIGIMLVRDILKQAQFYLIRHGLGFRKTVLIGPDWRCNQVLKDLHTYHGSLYQIIGYVSTDEPTMEENPYLPCLAPQNRLSSVLANQEIDHVIIAVPPDDHRQVLDIINICKEHNTKFQAIPEVFDHVTKKVSVEEIDMLPSIMFGETSLNHTGLMIKRAMDIVISLTAIVISFPIIALLAFLVRLDSSGEIFYVQERISNNGKKFRIYKLRSMVNNAEKDSGPVWATANDPRTTRFGRFIRRYNLDELPQFINVLQGDMSIVGPRPERPYFVDKFKDEIPLYMRRHMVKTGITGWAQVHGLRGDTPVNERTQYDLYYVKNWSVLLDIKIMWKTLWSFKNAY